MSTPKHQILGLTVWLLLTYLAAGIGAVASIRAASAYNELIQPAWAAPSSWFSPVWTALYFLMAVSAWLVWREGGYDPARRGLNLYLLQLAVNALWSWLFFGWFLGLAAFLDTLLLWVLILLTMQAFWWFSRLASLLLLPYLLWLTYAAALNFAVWQLNPAILG